MFFDLRNEKKILKDYEFKEKRTLFPKLTLLCNDYRATKIFIYNF